MTGKEEQKERSHGSILESAARLLRQRGISGSRVVDIMKGAGLTAGGFYAHFGSKEELIDEVLQRAATGLRERLFGRLDEKPAADRAEVVLKRYLSAAHRDNTESGCPLPAVVGEVGTTATEHREVLGARNRCDGIRARRAPPCFGGGPIQALYRSRPRRTDVRRPQYLARPSWDGALGGDAQGM